MSHFGAGLKHETKKVVSATPPGSVEKMLQAAEAVEAELAKIVRPGSSTLAVQEEPAPMEINQMSEIAEAIEEICAVIGLKRHQPFYKSHSNCYNCFKFSHYQSECSEPQGTKYRVGKLLSSQRLLNGGGQHTGLPPLLCGDAETERQAGAWTNAACI